MPSFWVLDAVWGGKSRHRIQAELAPSFSSPSRCAGRVTCLSPFYASAAYPPMVACALGCFSLHIATAATGSLWAGGQWGPVP